MKNINAQEREIIRILKNKLIEYIRLGKLHSHPKYFAMLDIVIYNQTIYFPVYGYFSMEEEPYDPKLQSYSSPTYCVVLEILKEVELPLPVAQQGDKVLCRCLNDNFHLSYGEYKLDVECRKYKNSWCAYDG